MSTPRDPASARLNQSLYQFLPQTIVYSLLSSLRLEQLRLKQNNLSFWNNDLYYLFTLQTLFTYLLLQIFTLKYATLYIMHGLLGVFFLEVVNYIEVTTFNQSTMDSPEKKYLQVFTRKSPFSTPGTLPTEFQMLCYSNYNVIPTTMKIHSKSTKSSAPTRKAPFFPRVIPSASWLPCTQKYGSKFSTP